MPGGTERVINTKSTTVVENIIEELCSVIGIEAANEREEFSLYCIVEGETFTVPLAKEHYILDVTTELQRDGAIYYLIFCRSVWCVIELNAVSGFSDSRPVAQASSHNLGRL